MPSSSDPLSESLPPSAGDRTRAGRARMMTELHASVRLVSFSASSCDVTNSGGDVTGDRGGGVERGGRAGEAEEGVTAAEVAGRTRAGSGLCRE